MMVQAFGRSIRNLESHGGLQLLTRSFANKNAHNLRLFMVQLAVDILTVNLDLYGNIIPKSKKKNTKGLHEKKS